MVFGRFGEVFGGAKPTMTEQRPQAVFFLVVSVVVVVVVSIVSSLSL